MSPQPIIEVRGLCVRYGQRTILEDVSFDILEGEVFLIVGGSGCGKSTLLRQIIGLETPAAGSIKVLGEELTTLHGKKRLQLLRKFGVLFQSSGLLASMTLAENISLALENIKRLQLDLKKRIIDLKLSAVGLAGFEEFLPSEISGGMKKRAALARAMANDPPILCFDEPSSGLDPVTSAALDRLILELNSALNTTMIVVTHDLASIMTIGSHVIMLDGARKGILAEGAPQLLKENETNTQVFNFFNRVG
jgi:phospholipid/cholesterol/gamma-HCH transport system ATP-binding protein